jgi:hypothetical protein
MSSKIRRLIRPFSAVASGIASMQHPIFMQNSMRPQSAIPVAAPAAPHILAATMPTGFMQVGASYRDKATGAPLGRFLFASFHFEGMGRGRTTTYHFQPHGTNNNYRQTRVKSYDQVYNIQYPPVPDDIELAPIAELEGGKRRSTKRRATKRRALNRSAKLARH